MRYVFPLAFLQSMGVIKCDIYKDTKHHHITPDKVKRKNLKLFNKEFGIFEMPEYDLPLMSEYKSMTEEVLFPSSHTNSCQKQKVYFRVPKYEPT